MKVWFHLGVVLLGLGISRANALELSGHLTPSQQDTKVPHTVDGRSVMVWKGDEKNNLLFKPTESFYLPGNGVIYLKMTYVDDGDGRIRVHLPGPDRKAIRPDRFLGLSRGNTKKLVTARMRVSDVQLPPGGELMVRVGVDHSSTPLVVESMSLQETPFANDPAFSFVISDPWKGPYTGPSIAPRDNTTLKGKVMVGYQGWFRTPNDPEGGGWQHWGGIPNGTFSIDMWPDNSQYPREVLDRAGNLQLKSGKPAYLFSSAWPQVVDTHFRWMREHDIDGAFVQRFVGSIRGYTGGPEYVLANVRSAANKEGRIWAVEYDVSGGNDATVFETLKKDWIWLVEEFQLLKDPNYAREGGKPVVWLWGLPVRSTSFSPSVADAVVDFFKNDPKYGGNYVIGGIPGNWRSKDSQWKEHFKKYDCVSPWMSRAYAEDIRDFKEMGVDYYAHAKPGFSWANLMHLPTGDESIAYEPRRGGQTYWDSLTKMASAGVERLFVGMFDEYDEGTAIMPMSDDAPPTPSRPGVASTFYNGPTAAEHGEQILLPKIELELGDKPPGRKIAAKNFFVRMGGQITFPKAGDYAFIIEGAPEDDVEFYLNGEKLIQKRNLSAFGEESPRVTAKAGQVMTFRMEYRHRTDAGALRLFWESKDVPKEVVPESAFRDAWGRFLTNEGKPADWWLQLTRMGKQMMLGKRPIDAAMPQPGR